MGSLDLLDGQGPEISDVAGGHRLTRSVQGLPDTRPEAVRGDRGVGGILTAVGAGEARLGADRDAADHVLAGFQRDVSGPAGTQQDVEQVVPVDDDVGGAEGLDESVAHVGRDQAFTRPGIRDDHPRRDHAGVQDRVEHPEVAQQTGCVGGQLQTGADLGESVGPLEDAH